MTEQNNNCHPQRPTGAPGDLDQQLDALAALPTPPRRVWEVDFLRGLLMIYVFIDHFAADIMMFRGSFHSNFGALLAKFAVGYESGTSILGALNEQLHITLVCLFVFLAGVSSSFSRNNFRRGIRMAVFAMLFSAVMFALDSLMYTGTAAFNVLHVVALSVLIYSLFDFVGKKLSRNWQKNIYGVVVALFTIVTLVVGYKYIHQPFQTLDIRMIVVNTRRSLIGDISSADYMPLLPGLGWFFLGAIIGKFCYRERRSLFPTVNEKYLTPITYIGSHSLFFYFASQVVMVAVLYLFTDFLGIL